MKKIAASLISLMAFGCAKPWSKVEPVQVSPIEPSAAEWRTTDHLVVLTDASGTMAREALIPEARAIAQSFVAGIPQGDVRAKESGGYDAKFIGFGGGSRATTELVPIEAASVLPAPNRSKLFWTAAELAPLGSPNMGSNTPLADVLGEASASLQGQTGPAAVVVISDGRADDAAASLDAGRALVAGYKDELCIHTVHMGDDAEGRAHLAQLASLSTDGCGSTRNAAGVRDVAGVQDLERDVFFGAAPLPQVASAGPCDQKIVLHGVQFAFDSAKLSPESDSVLDVALKQLQECADTSLSIEGHTCSIGTGGYNADLSSRRAASVREYLVGHGISAERLSAKGLGEENPVASNDSRDGRAQNRRVELVPAK